MGIVWAIAWSLTGILIGVISSLVPGILDTAIFRVLDAPLPALGVPGFFGGVFFSIVLGVAARKQRFRDLSMRRFSAWGALGGLLLALFPLLLVAVGLASPSGDDPTLIYKAVGIIALPFMLMGAACAAATLAIARKGEAVAAPEPEPMETTR